jgi:hypothetical protein
MHHPVGTDRTSPLRVTTGVTAYINHKKYFAVGRVYVVMKV